MQDISPPYLAYYLSKGLNSGVLGSIRGLFVKIAPNFGVQNFIGFLTPRGNGRLETKNGPQEAHKGPIEPL